jgi:cardiolipin synthase
MPFSYFIASLPNFISLVRLGLVPLAIVLIVHGQWRAAFVVFVAAGVSDAVDGFIAKRFDLQSELGAYLDPVADKALLVSIYVTLAIAGVIPVEIAILVVARDVMIVGAIVIAFLMNRPIAIRPLFVSKLNTAAQIVAAALILAAKAMDWDMAPWAKPALYLVAALTVASAAAYLAQWFDHMSARPRLE